MKEIDKKVLEAEIELKGSSEVSDTEMDGVSGGLSNKLSLKKGARLALDTSKAAMNSLGSKESESCILR